jgi:superfamily II DNA or RNA helicase
MHKVLEKDMIIIDTRNKKTYELLDTPISDYGVMSVAVKVLPAKTKTTIKCPNEYGEFIKQFDLDQFSKETISQKIYYQASTNDERMTRIAFRDIFDANLKRIDKSPVELWDYQKNAVAELCIKPRAILNGEMGVGKTRMYIAACYAYGCQTNLFVVESKLANELEIEFENFGLKAKVLKKAKDLDELEFFNIISYDGLKKLVEKKVTKILGKEKRITHADILGKNRIGTIILDECQNVKNITSQRTVELFKLKFKNMVLGSGTTVTNSMENLRTYSMVMFFKDNHKLTNASKWSQTVDNYWNNLYCPYNRTGILIGMGFQGLHTASKTKTLMRKILGEQYNGTIETDEGQFPNTKLPCSTGYLLPEYVSAEDKFNDIIKGKLDEEFGQHNCAPAIIRDEYLVSYTIRQDFKNMDHMSGLESSLQLSEIMRRHSLRIKSDHPNVLADMTIPKPDTKIIQVNPDAEQIDIYLKSTSGLRDSLKAGAGFGGSLSIFSVLHGLITASSSPQELGYKKDLTAKQKKVLEILKEEVGYGKKVIIFTRNTYHTEFLYEVISKEKGMLPVYLKSGHSISKRVRSLNDFRFRNSNVLITPFGLCKRGYNIPQSSVIIEADMIWDTEAREQAFRRILRPQQKKKPIIYSVISKKMIDEYMYNNQMKNSDHMAIVMDGASDGSYKAISNQNIVTMANEILKISETLKCKK